MFHNFVGELGPISKNCLCDVGCRLDFSLGTRSQPSFGSNLQVRCPTANIAGDAWCMSVSIVYHFFAHKFRLALSSLVDCIPTNPHHVVSSNRLTVHPFSSIEIKMFSQQKGLSFHPRCIHLMLIPSKSSKAVDLSLCSRLWTPRKGCESGALVTQLLQPEATSKKESNIE